MSSGEKQLVFNTRERVVSTDHNRLEAFIARDRSQLARFQYNDRRQNFYNNPGVSTQNVGTEVPLAADVYGGLMVDPQATSLLVTPGELGCLFPDPAITADDSPYMLIDDPGIQSTGILTFTANVSGQIRIDLVECQPVSTILETDNRDIFNPASGLFAPASVTKVQAFRLQYRIRSGTGGSGVPALQAGWLPLAAIVVASGAADFNACDFYDVRPLVEDRVRPQPAFPGGSYQPNAYQPVRGAEYFSQVTSGQTYIWGYAESCFNGYVAGGWLRRSSPSFSGSFTGTGIADGDPDFINVSLAENQTNFAPGANSIVYLAAFFPAGLPRWVRYSHSAVGGGFGRVPKGPRGVILATTQAPLNNGAITPLSIGHGFVAGAPGVVLGTIMYNSGGSDFAPVNARDGIIQSSAVPFTLFVTRTSGTQVDFAFTPGVHYPHNASEVLAQLRLTVDNGGSIDSGSLFAIVVETGHIVMSGAPIVVLSGTGLSIKLDMRIPLAARTSPTDPGGPTTTVRVTLATSGSSSLNAGANVQGLCAYGWRLGS